MAGKNERKNYERYDWWTEMRSGWEGEPDQSVTVTFGMVEMLQRSRMGQVLDAIEGREPHPFITTPSFT